MTPDIHWAELLLRLAVAAGLTGAIGLERELRERAAGLRTHMLVGVGSALFTIVSAYGWSEFVFDRGLGTVLDPTRIAAQIVTGVGFLGAGAIIRQGISIRGLTTAAGLWVVAAIGMAAGAGYYSAALIATGLVLVGLGPLRWLEGWLPRRGAELGGVLDLTLRAGQPFTPLIGVLEARRVRVRRMELEEDGDRRAVRIEVDLPSDASGHELVEEVARLDEVLAVRWNT